MRSGQSQGPGFQVALSELYRTSWYSLYAHVRRRGHVPEEAQDFFLHLLEHKTLTRADPPKDRFRSFFLGSLQSTVSDPADLDAEIHEVCEALTAAEGWLVP